MVKVKSVGLTEYEIDKLIETIDFYLSTNKCDWLKETRKTLVEVFAIKIGKLILNIGGKNYGEQ